MLIDYSIKEQVLDLLPYLSMASLMGFAVYAAGLLQFPSRWSLLLTQITAGIVVYVFLCRAFRLKAFMEIWQAGFNMIKKSGFKMMVQGFK